MLNGKFVNSGAATVFSISKTYISINEGILTFSAEYPTDNTIEAVQIPTMLEHPSGMTGTGVHFSAAEPNALPFDGWSIEYTPRAASCVKLIRDGETYDIGNTNAPAIVKFSETGYYLKLEKWIYKDNYPFVDGDILVIEGKFVNAGVGALMEIGKTYIALSGGMAYFFTEYPTGPIGPAKIQAGAMESHDKGWYANAAAPWGGLYFTMDANEAPFAADWSVRYVPTSAANVKLIRDGVTYDVANTGAEMIAKYGETDYFLEFWPISQKPIVAGDILIVEGNFVNAANNVVICIDRTYITLEADNAVFSTSAPDVLQAGHMGSHPNGWDTSSNEGLHFTLTENEIPYDGWSVEYEPVSANAVKLVRGGETFNIGIPSRGTIVKFGDTEYYLKLSAWTIGDYAPIVPGDTLIVEGEFRNIDNGVSFAVKRTVITVGEEYSLTFTAEESVDQTIQTGHMTSHPNGWNTQNNKGMYFTLTSNDIPYSDDWQTFYYPTTADNIQLIRDGVTVDIAQTDREYIVKYGDTDYYLKLEKWTIGDHFPLVPGDVLIVGGDFTNAITGVDFSIATTYITIGENYSLTFSEEAPEAEQPEVTEPEIPGQPMTAHSEKGWTAGTAAPWGGLYFTMAENDAPFESWSIRYNPTSAANVKLVRDGVSYDVGNLAAETIVKYSATEYHMEFWPISKKPVQAGDVLIVEGEFINAASGASIVIAKTTVTLNPDGTATFESEAVEPEDPEITEPETDGALQPHYEKGLQINGSEHLIYAVMEPNSGVQNGWETEYTPVAAAGLKLVRDGVSYDVGNPGQGTLVKYTDTEYCLKVAPWTATGGHLPLVAGDQIIVEGVYTGKAGTSCEGSTITIAKTTITYNADGTLTFESEAAEPEDPEVTGPEDGAIQAGAIKTHEKGWYANTEAPWGGLYFTMKENTAPFAADWSLRYVPTEAANVKLIRDGVTYDVANTGAEMITKYGETEYFLEFWPISQKPIVAGDVLVVEGKFLNAASGVIVDIAKTTVTLLDDGTAVFQSQEEEDPEVTEPEENVLQVGTMTENSGGITSGIIYFSLGENELPSSLTKSDFRPVDAGAIMLIRDGVTYDVADPNAKTIVKQTASKYRLLRSALTMELQTGDILLVDGKFTGGNSGTEVIYTIAIGKTYIFIGDGTVSFATELPAEE